MQKILKTLRYTVGPLFLILACPPLVFLFWYTSAHLDGSFLNLFMLFKQQGFAPALLSIWSPYFFGSREAFAILAIFAAAELFFMRYLPGKPFEGPVTPKGNVPVYKANGFLAYAATLFLYLLFAYPLGVFSPTLICDRFPELLGALNVFSLLFCLFLLVKGILAPSSSDSGASGNLIFDYYWGTELYPRIFGFDVKQFTNCRFGMMSWPLLLLSFAAKQHELYGLSSAMAVSVALQLVYITKFFIWETGYLRSLDIMHDRAGFYICWGCLVFVPGFYTSPTFYLINHPNALGAFWSAAIFIVGFSFILINYFADRQRQKVRATGGKCLVFGKKPELALARYVTERGEKKENYLLCSGWWGISRHFHYIPEVLGAFFWSVPALFENFLPYSYVVFLAVLLTDRAFRDDERCSKKYGSDWKTYCEKVPYKIIPYVV